MSDSGRLPDYSSAVRDLRAQYTAFPPGTPVRLGKATSNLFRFRDSGGPRLDVAAFDQVFGVDPVTRTAEVGGMTTYEHLVDATLQYGLMPLVVPQLKTITLGGAVAGLGIESTSFQHGLPHESVLEMDILCTNGEIVTASAEQNPDLFTTFPNSYGTLGYALRLRIELQPVSPYVRLRHERFGSASEAVTAIEQICAERSWRGIGVDFIDGTVFSREECYLTLGSFVSEAPGGTSDYAGQRVYYKSLRERPVDNLTVRDYLWRWDVDWFWCSRALGAQHPLVRRFWPRAKRRSDVYRKAVALDRKYGFSSKGAKLVGKPQREPVIQDVEIPVERLAEFLDFFHTEIGISPVWLCPLKLRGERTWPLYPMEADKLYVNVGFWATVPLTGWEQEGHFNRLIEHKVTELGGHKSLYSESFYTEEEFWKLYNGAAYEKAKKKYDPQSRAKDLYTKCVLGG
ncbi:FAD-binding oxidoreductase [Sciscionella marina]|uniref:FAD-binding oxidoreductase n=1 Tax=Sciscionella marina TaxID=508770 RepID=UPI0003725B41|nr:FAD-binding oxidoreductase [Sciscionella marina]